MREIGIPSAASDAASIRMPNRFRTRVSLGANAVGRHRREKALSAARSATFTFTPGAGYQADAFR